MKPAPLLLLLSVFLASCSKEQHEFATISATDWMSELLSAYPGQNITLTDIAIPASHDAGTYVKNDCNLGNECNTQTQHLDMTDQLMAGIRIFDIRPVLYNGQYCTQHFTWCKGYGCKGDLIQNMLSQTKTFLNAHSELVILKFSHFCDTGADDTSFINLVNGTLGERIYKEMLNDSLPFIHRPLNNIISMGQPGKAVVIYEETLADHPANRSKGMFTSSILPMEGGWSNVYIFDRLKQDQLSRFSSFSNDGSSLFEFSWTLTQNDSLAVACALYPDATSIRDLADMADSALAPTINQWIAETVIKKGSIPNIISVDFADQFVTEQCLKLSRLNLD